MRIHENSLDQNQVKNFHEFMPPYSDPFTKNIFATIDNTYHNLKDIVRDMN